MHQLLFIHKIIFSSTCFEPQVLYLQEDTVVHVQHMVLPLSMRVLGGLSVNRLSEFSLNLCTDRSPRTLVESDSTIGCMYTTVSS